MSTTITAAPSAPVVSHSVSFMVDDVPLKARRFLTVPVRESLVSNIGKKPPVKEASMSLMYSPVQDPYRVLGLSEEASLIERDREDNHPVIAAVHQAFSNHLPLTLSPDILWQTVLQGVSQHIRNQPEELRGLFVAHRGQQEMILIRGDLDFATVGNDITGIVSGFEGLLGGHVTKAYAELFRADYSTTTPIERTVAGITCMEAFSPYFSYTALCGCGFPVINLHGSVADWRLFKAKVIEIEELFDLSPENNLNWWTVRLRQIADQFISAAEGNPDTSFWKQLYKKVNQYLTHSFNGWIGWLFPYTKVRRTWDAETKTWTENGQFARRNPMLADILDKVTITDGWAKAIGISSNKPDTVLEFTESNERNVTSSSFSSGIKEDCFLGTGDFPSGRSSAKLKLVHPVTGATLDTILIGGFLGVAQDPATHALTPKIGYALLA